MKTIDLTGAALDWAVAKCEGFIQEGDEPWQPGQEPFAFSTDWAQGGPIIAREGLCVQPYCGLYEYNPIVEWESFVMARCFENEHPHGVGPTPLIAAMRCYVAFKLGETVEIPSELTGA